MAFTHQVLLLYQNRFLNHNETDEQAIFAATKKNLRIVDENVWVRSHKL